jgi:hypothetical protein
MSSQITSGHDVPRSRLTHAAVGQHPQHSAGTQSASVVHTSSPTRSASGSGLSLGGMLAHADKTRPSQTERISTPSHSRARSSALDEGAARHALRSRAMRRFFSGTTRFAAIAASALMAIGFVAGRLACTPALRWITDGAELIVTEESGLGAFLFFQPLAAGVSMALPAVLAWIVAAARGIRAGSPSSPGVYGVIAAPLYLVAIGSLAWRMWWLRRAHEALPEGMLTPTLSLDAIDCFTFAIQLTLVAAIPVAVVAIATTRKPSS